MSSREPPLARNSFHAETPRPPRSEYPLITGFLAAHGVDAQTRDQGSGVGKEGGSHPATAAGTGPADSPIRPDHSNWNCPSNAMAGCSRPAKDFYGCLPLTRHGHRCILNPVTPKVSSHTLYCSLDSKGRKNRCISIPKTGAPELLLHNLSGHFGLSQKLVGRNDENVPMLLLRYTWIVRLVELN